MEWWITKDGSFLEIDGVAKFAIETGFKFFHFFDYSIHFFLEGVCFLLYFLDIFFN